jgi:hypothetical protein
MTYRSDDPSPAEAPRDVRLRELGKLPKARLVAIYRPNCLGSAHPLSSWSRDELISSILSIEFPPAP